MTRAIIVGSEGQDGRILFDELAKSGAAVLGIGRSETRSNVPAGNKPLNILDRAAVVNAVQDWKPDEVYYLAANHHSSQDAALGGDDVVLFERSFDTHVRGLVNFLEAMKQQAKNTRLFYAASSLVFAGAAECPQTESTPFAPRCIYGITKAAGVECCRFYRGMRGIHASAGFLYNHESRYRREKFVSQKIIRGALGIRNGSCEKLVLGDLSARIDWGYAPDFTCAMRTILALDAPEDFVIATGESHSVQEFVETAFGLLGLDWQKHVEVDPSLLTRRRAPLIGDASKLRARTGWHPSVTFQQMIEHLIQDTQSAPEHGC